MWQSSNAADSYQPKFSLMPMVTGTLKAAALSLLFATPLVLVAGLAMGFALVPLGASAGIFAALMIGFGRAVGETMIVLMATGNTPQSQDGLFPACARALPISLWRCRRRWRAQRPLPYSVSQRAAAGFHPDYQYAGRAVSAAAAPALQPA
nr:phosphate ABC transporter permease [Candidatus Pantoea persica]